MVSFGSGSSNSNSNSIYLIDFEGQTLVDIGCSTGTPVFGLATSNEWQASDCTFSIDLDGDDSSDYLSKAAAGGFWSTVCTVPAPVADTDVAIVAGPPIDSISLQLDPGALSNGPDEFLTGAPSPAIAILGDGTWHLTLTNMGAALAGDFEAALEAVLYNNTAPSPNVGLRQITVTMWGQGGVLSRTVVSNIDFLYAGPLAFSFGGDTSLCPGAVLDLTIPYDYYQQVITPTDTLVFGTFTWQDGSHANTFEVTAPGVYHGSFTYEEAFGCTWADTIVAGQADTVLTSSAVTGCAGKPYFIGNLSFTTDTLVCIKYAAANGCDSTHCTDLVFLPAIPVSFIDTALCQGGSVSMGGQTYSVSGTYTDTLAGWNGCDSIVQLALAVLSLDTTDLSVQICEGSAYEVGGQPFSTAGLHEVLLTGQAGCDSLVRLDLAVMALDTTEISSAVCQGDTVFIGGQPFSTAGLYEVLLPGQNGCDSLVRLDLAVLPLDTTDISAAICEGDVYEVGGIPFSTAGLHEVLLPGQNGCDSLVRLTLSVAPLTKLETDTAICVGASVFFGGQLLTGPGTYVDTLVGQNSACDTVRILNLMVWPLPALAIQTEGDVCSGGPLQLTAESTASSFLWSTGEVQAGIQATGTGIYAVTVTDVHGCTATAMAEVDFSVQVEAALSVEPPSCEDVADGSIEITGMTGGAPPYLFSINGGPFTDVPFFGQLGGGAYTVAARDAGGCEWSEKVDLVAPAAFKVDAGPDQSIGLGGEVQLQATATQLVDSIWWLPPNGLVCGFCLQTLAMPQESTLYQIFALNQAGCLATDGVFVQVDKRAAVYAPTAFSPNGDGINDFFTLYAGKGVAGVEYLAIFDRWGDMVFEAENIAPNNLAAGWDGTWRGKDAPSGVYVWLARLRLINGEEVLEKGGVDLVR